MRASTAKPGRQGTGRTIELAAGQLLGLHAPRGRIRVTQGQAWLTESGDLRDTVLAAGEGWPLRGMPLMLGALVATRVQVCEEPVRGRAAAALLVRRASLSLLRLVQRLQFGPAEQAAFH